jgi:hypothetical protein
VNFFGHAALASRFSSDPAFVLGAMLPDLANMLALRPPAASDGALAAGMRFHHVTDEAFHELPAFRTLCLEGMRLLSAGGVSRGTRRAVAHVGVELMIDAELAENAEARAAYLGALRACRDRALLERLGWPPDQKIRLASLATVLEERSDGAKPTTATLVERLVRTLAKRPRLAIADSARAAVADWVELARGRVVASAPALLADLVAAIRRVTHDSTT